MSAMSFVLVNDTKLSSKNSSSLNSTIMNKDVQDKNSNISEPNEIDAEVHNIMSGVGNNNDELCKRDAIKNLFMSSQSQIEVLNEDIKFLREDSKNKSIMINKLINIMQLMHSNKEDIYSTTKSDISSRAIPPTSQNHDLATFEHRNKPRSEYARNTFNGPMVSNGLHLYDDILNELDCSTRIQNVPVSPKDNHRYYQVPPLMGDHEGFNTCKDISNVTDTLFNSNNSINRFNDDIGNNANVLGSIYRKPLPLTAHWKRGTTLIIGDSLLYGIDEARVRNSEVQTFPGALIEDMFHFVYPYLRKKPSNIIIHAGTNNSVSDYSLQIIEKLFKLKEFIISELPDCRVIFSQIINRYDDGKAQLMV